MKPLILDFKISRSEADYPVLYSYDYHEDLNVISVDGNYVPFIDITSSDLELTTKTKINRENDDDSLLLELETKTEIVRERDDKEDTLLEMESKTLVKRERDDVSDLLLEMQTKTRVKRETDDIDFDNN